MPHARILDESSMDIERAELTRSRIHYRAGKRKLADGRTHEGLSTLFDSFLSGLRWYVASPGRVAALELHHGDNLNDEKAICEVLKRSRLLDRGLDFDRICGTVERALDGDLTGLDTDSVVDSMETVLLALGVIPFDESKLPPEPND